MKNAILLAVCLLSMTTVINAQEGQKNKSTEKNSKEKLTAEQRAKKQVETLNTEVALTDDQKTKIYNLALTKVKKVDEIRAKYKGQPENKDASEREILTVKQEFRKNVNALLTPEQAEKAKAKHKEMKAAGKASSLDHD